MKRTVYAVVWLLALCLCLVGAAKWTARTDSARKYGDFFKTTDKQESYDVLFFGTSHVLGSILPMELYRDHGIKSYNMGNNSEPLEMTKWVMETTFKKHKPKIAVIDVFYVDKRIDESWTYAFRHLFLDAQPLSLEKFNIVKNTLPKSEWGEFMVPFTLYHGRWEELLSNSVVRQVDTEPCAMGAEMRMRVMEPNPYERTTDTNDKEYPGYQPLRDMVEICRANGVEPVFMCVPSPATYEEQVAVNNVQRIADDLNVPYINMHDVPGHVVDFETDCFDSYSHLNIRGAEKVTAFMGDWLKTNYEITDHRGENAKWDERLAEFEDYKTVRYNTVMVFPD